MSALPVWRPSHAVRASAQLLEDEWLDALLLRLREYFGVEAACVMSLHRGTELRFEHTSGELADMALTTGEPISWEKSLSRQLAGEAFAEIADVANDPRTAHLDQPRQLGIGRYAGIPIVLRDGTMYGLLCCVSHTPRPGPTPDGRVVMQFASDLVAERLEVSPAESARRDSMRRRFEVLLAAGGPAIALQGVFDLNTMRLDGFEALSRFPRGWGPPDRCFAQAAEAGLGLELELAAIRNAFAAHRTANAGTLSVGVNVSPSTFVSAELLELVESGRPAHLVVELTEHEEIEDYREVRAARQALAERGVLVAADDAGAGYAGLRHLVELQPDCIKLDRSLVANIDRDPARRALADAIARFARDQGAIVIVEGIETEGELVCCRDDLDIALAQGYFLHRPEAPWEDMGIGLPPPIAVA